MTRRALFAALASLPFVGRFVKKPTKEPLDWVEWGGPLPGNETKNAAVFMSRYYGETCHSAVRRLSRL